MNFSGMAKPGKKSKKVVEWGLKGNTGKQDYLGTDVLNANIL